MPILADIRTRSHFMRICHFGFSISESSTLQCDFLGSRGTSWSLDSSWSLLFTFEITQSNILYVLVVVYCFGPGFQDRAATPSDWTVNMRLRMPGLYIWRLLLCLRPRQAQKGKTVQF